MTLFRFLNELHIVSDLKASDNSRFIYSHASILIIILLIFQILCLFQGCRLLLQGCFQSLLFLHTGVQGFCDFRSAGVLALGRWKHYWGVGLSDIFQPPTNVYVSKIPVRKQKRDVLLSKKSIRLKEMVRCTVSRFEKVRFLLSTCISISSRPEVGAQHSDGKLRNEVRGGHGAPRRGVMNLCGQSTFCIRADHLNCWRYCM